MKLFYFPLAGRAETTRLMLKLSNTSFEDVRVEMSAWPEMRPKAPLGQLPWLELDCGKTLAQQLAIEDYIAKKTGFYPEDAWNAARGDEIRGLLYELFGLYLVEEVEESKELQQTILVGEAKTKLEHITKRLEAAGSEFLGGAKPSVADISLYSVMEFLATDFFEGIPADFVDSWPVIKKACLRVKALVDAKA